MTPNWTQEPSVRELVEALTDASEVVRDRLRMAEAAGNKKDIKWASEIFADAQAALAKFKLEDTDAKTADRGANQ